MNEYIRTYLVENDTQLEHFSAPGESCDPIMRSASINALSTPEMNPSLGGGLVSESTNQSCCQYISPMSTSVNVTVFIAVCVVSISF